VPTFRPDLASIPKYVPGKPIADVAREFGLTSIDKLASNECPEPPFPEIVPVIASMASSINRYPDDGAHELTTAIGAHLDVPTESVWPAAGSSENLRSTALAVGGPGTSAVYAVPSFVMYAIGTLIAHAEPITVPLTASYSHDLDAMAGAIRDDTTVVYVCNPNNPTGGIRSGADVRGFIDTIPERVTVVIDEAYAEYVTDPSYSSMVHDAVERPNVLVTRTFSKIYGLAGLRVGYAVGSAELVSKLRAPQAPFSVSSLAQVAAVEALRHSDRVDSRRERNANGRDGLSDGLRARGVVVADSQANFVYFEPDGPPTDLAEQLMRRGVIVRPLGPGLRVTVGTDGENQRFLAMWDDVEPANA
jgi:histidinol-phosphate aminotransferase